MEDKNMTEVSEYQEADENYKAFHTAVMKYLEKVKDYENQSEGSSIQDQIEYDYDLIDGYPNIKNILEIGMNMGISTVAFLSVRPDIHVTSVDICSHNYVEKCKEMIDQLFPDRHTLLKGNSVMVVPQIPPTTKYDLIFVDGNHKEPYPLLDIQNILPYCHEETFIMVDDLCDTYGKEGVYQAIDQLLQEKKIKFIEQVSAEDRGWGIFRKVFA